MRPGMRAGSPMNLRVSSTDIRAAKHPTREGHNEADISCCHIDCGALRRAVGGGSDRVQHRQSGREDGDGLPAGERGEHRDRGSRRLSLNEPGRPHRRHVRRAHPARRHRVEGGRRGVPGLPQGLRRAAHAAGADAQELAVRRRLRHARLVERRPDLHHLGAQPELHGGQLRAERHPPVTRQEVRFAVDFKPAIALPADQYFFIPQVQVDGGNFFWLSAPKPIVAPGTPFGADLQAWIRNADLDPDWLRVGTDIVGAGAFNGTFSLQGTVLASPTPLFNGGEPDGKMAMASRPENGANIEIEAADDVLFPDAVGLTSATFTGLIPAGSNISRVVVEIYRVFPKDSDAQRTPRVPTRNNSPSDVAFDTRDSSDGSLGFASSVISASFTAANSVLNGIRALPANVTTHGEGPVTGQEIQLAVTFTKPLLLPADHYFVVPQVQLDNGNFFWLSAPKPIVAPGTPFLGDLQTWIRNGDLDPDWLRVGADIVGAGAFNAAFTLSGQVIPAPLQLSPAHLSVGLKNSDDQGAQFDMKVELLRNGTSVASGLDRCITGVTRNPDLAKE